MERRLSAASVRVGFAVPTVGQTALLTTPPERGLTWLWGDGMSNTRRRDQRRASISEVLSRIRALVQRAAEDARRPPIAGTRRPWAVQAYLDRDAWPLIWQAVDYLHERHFDLYSRFLHERTIDDHIVNLYAETPEAPATAKAVIAELERIIDEEGTWIIEVPIAHAVPVRASIALDKRAMLVRAEQVRDWDRSGTQLADPFAVFNHLGDDLTPRPRWLRAPTDDFVDIDARWTSALRLLRKAPRNLLSTLRDTAPSSPWRSGRCSSVHVGRGESSLRGRR